MYFIFVLINIWNYVWKTPLEDDSNQLWAFIHLFIFHCCITLLPECFPQGSLRVYLIWAHSWTGVQKSRESKKQQPKNSVSSVACQPDLHQAHHVPQRRSLWSWHAVQKPELCPWVPQKSFTTICVCSEVVENVACLSQGVSPGLSQGLVGRARWSGWGCRLSLPPPPPSLTPPSLLQREIKHRS